MQILMALGCVVFVLSILTAAALPAYGITAGGGHIALQGVFIAKNLMGNMAVLLLTPALFMRPIRRSRRALYVCLMLLLIVLSFSVQAWAATLLCFGFAFQRTMSRRLRGRDMAWLFYVAVVPALAAFAFLLAYWTDTLQFLGKDPTLSGRTVIWDAVLKSIAKKPFLGWGFNAFWQGFTGESANVAMEVHFFIAQAQNGLLEVLLEVGGVGALLVISSFVQAFRHFFKTSRSAEPDNVDWYILIVILTMFYSLGEADLLGQNSVPWMLYILACCGLALCANPIGRPRGAPRLV
jgi:O-antigen ligase